MKRLMFTAATLAMAAALPAFAEEGTVEHYNYSTPLDIAHVVAMDPVPDVCTVVPIRMTYDDSHGQRHVLEYEVMGGGCTD